MVEQSPALAAKVLPSGQNPVWQLNYRGKDGGARFFKPIANEAKAGGQSGPRPHAALCDEVHEHIPAVTRSTCLSAASSSAASRCFAWPRTAASTRSRSAGKSTGICAPSCPSPLFSALPRPMPGAAPGPFCPCQAQSQFLSLFPLTAERISTTFPATCTPIRAFRAVFGAHSFRLLSEFSPRKECGPNPSPPPNTARTRQRVRRVPWPPSPRAPAGHGAARGVARPPAGIRPAATHSPCRRPAPARRRPAGSAPAGPPAACARPRPRACRTSPAAP